MSAFDDALELLLEVEGGYSHHEHDRGGKTRYGITESLAERRQSQESFLYGWLRTRVQI